MSRQEKLVRGAKPDAVALAGVAIGELTLATMTAAPPLPIAGAVRRLEIAGTPHGFAYRIEGERTNGRFVVGATRTLVPLGGAKLPGVPLAVLTAGGALPVASVAVPGRCPVVARDRTSRRPEDAPSCFRHVGNRRERSAARSVRAWPDFRSRKRVVTYADEQKIAAAHR